MDDVDRIIFDTLSRLECSFCDARVNGEVAVRKSDDDEASNSDEEQVQSKIERLSTADVVEAVVRLLWACDPTTKATVPSYELSGHATARFRMANKLAGALKKLGLREEFGYQSLLYHNVYDVRRLFLALIEKLPDESLFDQSQPSLMEQLKLDSNSDIGRHLDAAWVPEFCRYLRMKYDGRFWHPNEEGGGLFPFGRNRPTRRGYRRGDSDAAVISQGEDTDDTASVASFTSDSDGRRSAQQKPKVPPKPPHLQRGHSPLSSVANTGDAAAERLARIEQKRRELIELRYAQIRLEEGIARINEQQEKIDSRLLQSLANPEESIAKLQEVVGTLTQRRMELQESFYEMQRTKQKEIDELRTAMGRSMSDLSADERTAEARKETARLRQLVEQCRATAAERTRIKAKLERELRKSTSRSSTRGQIDERSQYVRRVLEIVASVKKQDQEILRTAKAIKKLEHEIETLDGTLERTFAVVEAWLGARTDMDTRMERAYRFLIRMHEHCGLIRAAIDERAQITRHIDELAGQVEAHRESDVQLERILNDLLQIRQENQELLAAAGGAATAE